jgi:hypothetical protein
MEAEFFIGDTPDGRVDKWDKSNKSQPPRKFKMKIGKESRVAAGVCEMGHHLRHGGQAQSKHD